MVNTAGVKAGAKVIVIGCGGVGLNSVQGARLAGCSAIVAVDLSDAKLEANANVSLGLTTAAFGVAAGTLAAYVIVAKVMDIEFEFYAGPALAAACAGLALTVVLGMIGAWRILGQKPAAFLRSP